MAPDQSAQVPPGPVYLVDDDPDVLHFVGLTLERAGYTVRAYADPDLFLNELRLEEPSVVLLDMAMPVRTGLDLQAALMRQAHAASIIFLSGNSQQQQVIDAIKGGAHDFLLKPARKDQILNAVADAMAQSVEKVTNNTLKETLRAGLGRLTAREGEVFPLIVAGYQNRQIAEILGIQTDTAKKHRASICEKFNVTDSVWLIALARDAERIDAKLWDDPEFPTREWTIPKIM